MKYRTLTLLALLICIFTYLFVSIKKTPSTEERIQATINNIKNSKLASKTQTQKLSTNSKKDGILLSQDRLASLRSRFSQTHRQPKRNLKNREKEIWLKSRTILTEKESAITKIEETYKTLRGTQTYLLHFNQLVSAEIKEELTNIGVVIHNYIPNNSLLIEANDSQLTSLQAIDIIDFLTNTNRQDRISPFISYIENQYEEDISLPVKVQTLKPEDDEFVTKVIEDIGAEVKSIESNSLASLIRTELSLKEIQELSKNASVRWIEEDIVAKTSNDMSQIEMNLNTTQARDTWGLTGEGEIIAHADTGLSTGVQDTLHPDFRGRVLAILNTAKDDCEDLDSHGTHTAASILGTGLASKGQFMGTAPQAMLVHQGISGDSGVLITSNYDEILKTPYENYNARIRSDSWGSASYGSYLSDSQTLDLFHWERSDFISLMAAGNLGIDKDQNGVIDLDSIASPATAKNAITVGASENFREPEETTYSSKNYSYIGTEPIASDYRSFSLTAQPYQQGIAAFSSRGPCDDGRIKPDIVAPGTATVSAMAKKCELGDYFPSHQNNAYVYMQGTSMSCPLAAGSAALIRQYIRKYEKIDNPSGALIKATLLGVSSSLSPGQYGTGLFQEIPSTSPNNVEGWGQPDISNSLFPTGSMLHLIDDVQPEPNQINSYTIDISEEGKPLNIVLSWFDYPAELSSAITLINDLDLSLITPTGEIIYPNDLDQPDRLNTNESIRIPNAAIGSYEIQIKAYNTPYPNGMAGLYISGAFDAKEIIVHQQNDFIPIEIDGSYAIDLKIQSFYPLDKAQCQIYWSQEGGNWQQSTANWSGAKSYRAELPLGSKATQFDYYILCQNNGRSIRFPERDQALSTTISRPVRLNILGKEAVETETYTSPYYGRHNYCAGENVELEAFTYTGQHTNTNTCIGWTGSGSVPTSGTENKLEFIIEKDSTINWIWNTEAYTCLIKSYSQPDDYNRGVLLNQSYNPNDTLSYTAPTEIYDLFSQLNGYSFMGWTVNAKRWPDESSVSPLTIDLIIDEHKDIHANYMDATIDENNNEIADFYEYRIAGELIDKLIADADNDGDGYTNREEYLNRTDLFDPESLPKLPVITVYPIEEIQENYSPWEIAAKVEDTNPIASVYLIFWEENAEETQQVEMLKTDGNELYTAELNPVHKGDIQVHYSVIAYDSVLSDQFSQSPTYECISTSEETLLEISSINSNLYINETTQQEEFTIKHVAGPENNWSTSSFSPTHILGAPDECTHEGDLNAWNLIEELTDKGVESVWYCGDPETKSYYNSSNEYLDTPAFTVLKDDLFYFRHKIETEFYKDTIYWDYGKLLISTDGGNHFEDIAPLNAYPHQSIEGSIPCFGSTEEQWNDVILNLSEYESQEVIIRFYFFSDANSTEEGWYVKDIERYSKSESSPLYLNISPNEDSISVQEEQNIRIEVDPTKLIPKEDTSAILSIHSDTTQIGYHFIDIRTGNTLNSIVHENGGVYPEKAHFINNIATCQIQADEGFKISQLFINGIEMTDYKEQEIDSQTIQLTDTGEDQTLEVFFNKISYNYSIQNEYGDSQPIQGEYSGEYNSEINLSITEPEIELTPAIKRVCTGWDINDGEETGTETSLTLKLNKDINFKWIWELQYLVSAGIIGKGDVDPEFKWRTEDSITITTASPAECFEFEKWLGDTENSSSFGNKLVYPVTAPRVLLAEFNQIATENHKIPYQWLQKNGIHANYEEAVEENPDKDPSLTFEEYIAGTDPNDAESYLKIKNIEYFYYGTLLEWESIEARTYSIYKSTDLENFELIDSVQYPQSSLFISAENEENEYYFLKATITDED